MDIRGAVVRETSGRFLIEDMQLEAPRVHAPLDAAVHELVVLQEEHLGLRLELDVLVDW